MVDPEELLKDLQAKAITKIKIGVIDIDGVLRGKYVSLDKLKSALKKGFGFAMSSSAGTSPTCSTTTWS